MLVIALIGFYLFPGEVIAATDLNNFEIKLVGDGPAGKTYTPTISIHLRHRWGSNAPWGCLPDPLPNYGYIAHVWANNSAQTMNYNDYYYLSEERWTCVNGWSQTSWDLTDFGGNAAYGVKNVYFQLRDNPEASGGIREAYTSRAIVYEQQPVPPPTTPPVSPPTNVGGSTSSNPQSTKPKSQATKPTSPAGQKIEEKVEATAGAPAETKKDTDQATVAEASTDKKDLPYTTILFVILAAGAGFFIARLKPKAE